MQLFSSNIKACSRTSRRCSRGRDFPKNPELSQRHWSLSQKKCSNMY